MSNSDSAQIYLRRLEHALGSLPRTERAEIVAETASHIHERSADGAIDAVLRELGSPEDYAEQFLAGRVRPETLTDVGSPGTRASSLIVVLWQTVSSTLVLLLCALTAVKLLNPRGVGVWMTSAPRHYQLAIGSSPATGQEILGYWLATLALLLALVIHMTSRIVVHRIRTKIAARANRIT